MFLPINDLGRFRSLVNRRRNRVIRLFVRKRVLVTIRTPRFWFEVLKVVLMILLNGFYTR